jgi:hypothetical protein
MSGTPAPDRIDPHSFEDPKPANEGAGTRMRAIKKAIRYLAIKAFGRDFRRRP